MLGWAKDKFPNFFRSLRYVLVERSRTLCERIRATLQSHLNSGKAELRADLRAEALSLDVPVIIFANEFFDALPVEIISAKVPCASMRATAVSLKSGLDLPAKKWNSSIAMRSIPDRTNVLKRRCWLRNLWTALLRTSGADFYCNRLRLHAGGTARRSPSWNGEGRAEAFSKHKPL